MQISTLGSWFVDIDSSQQAVTDHWFYDVQSDLPNRDTIIEEKLITLGQDLPQQHTQQKQSHDYMQFANIGIAFLFLFCKCQGVEYDCKDIQNQLSIVNYVAEIKE